MAVAAAEAARQSETLEHPGILDAKRFYERDALEQEAQQLIDNWSRSSAPEVLDQEYNDNSRTALMEALTESGHLSRIEIEGDLEQIEDQMLGRLLNGWDDRLPEHEKDRRFAELVNLLYGRKVRQAVVAGELPENTALLELSDYPEALKGARLGYRDKNKKGMVRSTHLESVAGGQYRLIIEQGSRSDATWRSTFGFLNACGVQPEHQGKQPDVVALETPLVYSTYDYVDGVVDVMRHLDRHAGNDVLYGDKGADKSQHVAYEYLREESIRREREIQHFTDDLAVLEKQLNRLADSGDITWQERSATLHGEIERILEAICTLEPEYAEATFGGRAAPGFYAAAEAAAQGDHARAQQLIERTLNLREEAIYCGGGMSPERAKQLEQLGINVNSYDKLLTKGKNSWGWKMGSCVIKSCENQSKKVEVGPCSICRSCQAKFDKGEDPSKLAAVVQLPKKGRSFKLFETAAA